MNLYLVQHAEPVKKEQDPERPLSSSGVDDIKKIADYVSKNCNITADKILHSGKLRALQTAEILATTLNIASPVETDGLAPLDSPAIWAERLSERTNDIMLVGHLPHMSRLASTLLSGILEANIIRFQMGGIVALTRDENLFWSLSWMIVPAILP